MQSRLVFRRNRVIFDHSSTWYYWSVKGHSEPSFKQCRPIRQEICDVSQIGVTFHRICPLTFCVAGGIVGGDEGPVGGVTQVVCHGVKVVGVHGEEGQEEYGEVRGEVKGEVEENQGQPLMCMA